MTEHEWAVCRDARRMLRFLAPERHVDAWQYQFDLGRKRVATNRKLYLFCCAMANNGLCPPFIKGGALEKAYELVRAQPGARAANLLRDIFGNIHSPLIRPWGLKVGDTVIPVPGHVIACGSGSYPRAVVVSLDPFVLVSEEGDMLWSQAHPAPFLVERGEHQVPDTSASFARWERDKKKYTPHKPPRVFDPAWRTPAVMDIAKQAYNHNGMFDAPALRVLADALQEAGCDIPEINVHLSSKAKQKVHVRGCWALDLILGEL